MNEKLKQQVLNVMDEVLKDAPFEVGGATAGYFVDAIEQLWDALEYSYNLLMGK